MHEVAHQGKVVSETATLVKCGQMALSSNQVAGFFDQKYLWKESIDILIVCLAIIIKGRKHLRQPIEVKSSQKCPSLKHIAGFFDQQYMEGIN